MSVERHFIKQGVLLSSCPLWSNLNDQTGLKQGSVLNIFDIWKVFGWWENYESSWRGDPQLPSTSALYNKWQKSNRFTYYYTLRYEGLILMVS